MNDPGGGEAEPRTASSAPTETPGCRNCGATLTGPYCAACGQAARIHRSALTFGRQMLQSLFFLEGKLWQTMPELIFRPGRLTRRYIDGERAKFIAPMTLFLFSVLLTYAIFSLTGGPVIDVGGPADVERRGPPAAERRARNARDEPPAGDGSVAEIPPTSTDTEGLIPRSVTQINDNPDLFAYDLQANAYKYAWALVPLSIPFLWLLFFWRRDVRLYDHAVFVTYSLSFMLLLLICASLLRLAGLRPGAQALMLLLIPPVHLYVQLRDTYRLSMAGASLRLALLVAAIAVVLLLFMLLLLSIGAIG